MWKSGLVRAGFFMAASTVSGLGNAREAIEVSIQPAKPFVEPMADRQLVNFDFIIRNDTQQEYRLTAIEMDVLDTDGHVVLHRFLDGGGSSPAIETVPNRTIPSRDATIIFNPLEEIPADRRIDTLRYVLSFSSDSKETARVVRDVKPIRRASGARLTLPLRGRILVHDAHELTAHHRRWNYLHPLLRDAGFNSNPMRYAFDLVPIDEQGIDHHGPPEQNDSWVGFGSPVLAPAEGRVVALSKRAEDDRQFDAAGLKKNMFAFFGNYIILEHKDGTHSLLAHLQKDSISVEQNEHVSRGQVIARLGASGAVDRPHLHYQLQGGPDAHAEGVPAFFDEFRRELGDGRVERARRSSLESGEIIRN